MPSSTWCGFKDLHDFATRQSVDTQTALVHQLEATIQGDQAAIDSAQVQLDYTDDKSSPISSRPASFSRRPGQHRPRHRSEWPGGDLQLQPISVIFTLPEHYLRAVSQEMQTARSGLCAGAFPERQGLGEGTVALVDNQIDRAPARSSSRRRSPNDNHALWPSEDSLTSRCCCARCNRPSRCLGRPCSAADGMYVYVVRRLDGCDDAGHRRANVARHRGHRKGTRRRREDRCCRSICLARHAGHASPGRRATLRGVVRPRRWEFPRPSSGGRSLASDGWRVDDRRGGLSLLPVAPLPQVDFPTIR